MSLEQVTSIEPPRYLLLLPPPSNDLSVAALKAAYGTSISEVLKEVVNHSSESPKAAVLEIAQACPHLVVSNDTSRSALYNQTQSLLSGIYKLVVSIAAQENVNVEDADGVDVRIILIAWDPDEQPSASSPTPYGPVIDLETLAHSERQWRYAFGVESETGARFVQAFVAAKGSRNGVSHVQSGSVQNTSENSAASTSIVSSSTAPSNPTYQKHYDVAVGGTWDHLHIGHKLLVTMTLFAVDSARQEGQERTATIGITGDQLLVNKKHASFVESWSNRQQAVATFFNAIVDFSTPATSGQRHVSITDDPGPNGKSLDVHYPNGLVIKCVEIQDPFGPTITVERISALVISAETRSGGKAVNDRRKEQGWRELDVLEVDVLDADDNGQGSSKVKDGFDSKISSTAIREKIARKSGTGKM